jgi:hypothetical protein
VIGGKVKDGLALFGGEFGEFAAMMDALVEFGGDLVKFLGQRLQRGGKL